MKSRLLGLCLVVLLAGCSATSQKNDYYTLSSPYVPVGGASVPIQGESWKVSSVTIPEMLNRPQIVIKTGDTSVTILEYARWAEPLDSMIFRILGEDLHGKMPDNDASTKNREITVAIDEFDADESGHVVLISTWKVKTEGRVSEYVFSQSEAYPPGNINAMVVAMSHLVALLAESIAHQP